MRKIAIEEAIGLPLGHDITEILPGKVKRRAFRRGHIIKPQDIERLRSLGKEHIYVWEAEDHLVHEDDAAVRLARSAAGFGVSIGTPNQGRVNLQAAIPGLLKIRVNQLQWVNNCDGIIFATLHNNSVVNKHQVVAGTRIIPLAIHEDLLLEAEHLASRPLPLVEVKPFQPLWVAVVTTGSEVNSGLIRDGFSYVVRQKVNTFGGRWMGQTIVPDDAELIAGEIHNFIAEASARGTMINIPMATITEIMICMTYVRKAVKLPMGIAPLSMRMLPNQTMATMAKFMMAINDGIPKAINRFTFNVVCIRSLFA